MGKQKLVTPKGAAKFDLLPETIQQSVIKCMTMINMKWVTPEAAAKLEPFWQTSLRTSRKKSSILAAALGVVVLVRIFIVNLVTLCCLTQVCLSLNKLKYYQSHINDLYELGHT